MLALLFGRFDGALCSGLRHLFPVLDGLLTRLDRLRLQVVGHRAELLVLDAARRSEETGEEADCRAGECEPERVALSGHLHPARTSLNLARVRRCPRDP